MASGDWIFCDCCSGCNLAMDERISGFGGASISFTERHSLKSGTGTGTSLTLEEYTGTGSGSGSCGFGGQITDPMCDWRKNGVATVRMIFSSKKIADAILGEGNYRTNIGVSGVSYVTKTDDDDVLIESENPYEPYVSGPSDRYLLFADNDWMRGRNEGSGTGSFSTEVKAKISVADVVFVTPDSEFIGYLVPMSIEINDHVWMRKSNCPSYISGNEGDGYDWGDFQVWELQQSIITGDKAPEAGPYNSRLTRCMSMEIVTGAASVAWQPPEQSVVASVINHDNTGVVTGQPCIDGLCEFSDDTLCLQLMTGSTQQAKFRAQLFDGWLLGGAWIRNEYLDRFEASGSGSGSGTGSSGGCEEHTPGDMGDHCGSVLICNAGYLVMQGGVIQGSNLEGWDAQPVGFPWPGGYCFLGGFSWGVATGGANVWFLAGREEDVRTFPGPGEWDLVTGPIGWASAAPPGCTGDLDKLEFGGDCLNTNDIVPPPPPPPPDSCPVQWCKFVWSGSSWYLDSSNCVAPAVCPDPPTGPPGLGEPWVQYLCCETSTPSCPGGDPLCADTCLWTWNGTIWLGSRCATDPGLGGCYCAGMPERSGLFVGETVAGYCCPTGGGPPP